MPDSDRIPRGCAPASPTLYGVPGIDERHAEVLEVGDVARDDGLAVHGRGGGDQRIGHVARAHGGDAAPLQGDLVADRQDPARVVDPQLLEPAVQRDRRRRVGSGLLADALHDFAERHDAQEDLVRIDRPQPVAGFGPPTPGFGFGSGLERVTLVAGLEEAEDEGPLAYVVSFVPESRADAFALAQHLRRDLLIDAECDLAGRSAKAQLRQAGRSGAELALLVGLADLADGEVRLRDLESGDEEDVAIAELGDWFDDWLDDDDLDGHGHHHGNCNGNPLGGNGGGDR